MSVSRALFVAASVAVLANIPFEAHAQQTMHDVVTAMNAERDRLAVLNAKAAALPKAVRAHEWQAALLAQGNALPRPQNFADLLIHYENALPVTKKAILAWVGVLASEVVMRGDGHMVMLLAQRYVKKDYSLRANSGFANAQRTLNANTDTFGNIVASTLKRMQPHQQKAFRTSFAQAVGATLVTNETDANGDEFSQSHGDFVAAVLGFQLLRKYVEMGDPDIRAETRKIIDDEIKDYQFTLIDLERLWGENGIDDFQKATNAFLVTKSTGLSLLLQLAPRATKDAGRVMRETFAQDFSNPKSYEYALYVYDLVHRNAVRQRIDGKENTLSEQMLSLSWDKALSDVLTPERINTIYFRHYFEGDDKRPKSYAIARAKQLTPAQQTDMTQRFQYLLGNAVGKPKIYFQILKDFEGDQVFAAALDKFQPEIKPRHVAAHFKYLAGIYINPTKTTKFDETVDSNRRLIDLIKTIADRPLIKNIKPDTLSADAKVFQASIQGLILKITDEVKGDEAKSYQLAKVVHNAVVFGWANIIDPEFLKRLESSLKGTAAKDQIMTSIRVQIDIRTRAKQRGAVVKPAAPSKK